MVEMSELCLIDIPWETRNLGMPAYQLEGNIKNHKVVESILEKKQTELKENFFVQFKVDAEKTKQVIDAQKAGLKLIEMSISPYLDLNKVKSSIISDISMTPYSLESSLRKNSKNHCYAVGHLQDSIKQEIIYISKKTFNADRFHMDPNCMKSIADKRMGLWVELDIFQDSQNYCSYTIFNNRLVGYVIWNQTGIVLNGLSPNYKGMGFGKALYIQTILDAIDKGLKEIATNISVNNLSALNLYSKLNFSFREPKYFLHYWS